MTWFEIACCALVIYGLIKGWCNGFIKEFCSSVGLLLGIMIAWKYYDQFGNGWLALLLVILVPITLSLLAMLLTGIVKHTCIINGINRLFGALLGATKYLLLILFILYLVNKVQAWKAMLPELPDLPNLL